MPLTRDFKETVSTRIQKDSTFATALLNEAISLFLNGEPETARLILRDLINSTIGFEELAAETSKPSKSLHRMLSAKGNPTMDNLNIILNVLRKKLDVDTETQIVSPKASETTYIIEYWIEATQFPSKEELAKHVEQKLHKFLPDTKLEIEEKAKYLLLRIVSTKKGICRCYKALGFQREWSFRAKDELADSLRSKAYPILAEIELRLRSFISQAMIEVFGFDWWKSFIPRNLKDKVSKMETKEKKDQVELHHPIEFTFFDDLMVIITAKFQDWTDDQTITELLSKCSSIEDIKQEVNNRRRIISFWDDIFSGYFDDKNAWIQLEKNIYDQIIPIRNKVMHHRLIRDHDLQELKECRDEMKNLLDSAKPNLSDVELEEIQPSVKTIMKSIMAIDVMKGAMLASKAIQSSDSFMKSIMAIDLMNGAMSASKAIQSSNSFMKSIMAIDLMNGAMSDSKAIQPDSIIKAMSATAAINSELLKAMSATAAINEASD